MRTCAAHMLAGDTEGRAQRDAIDLLIEASNALELRPQPEPLGEPMPILPQPPKSESRKHIVARHTDEPISVELQEPPASPPRPRSCPKCDSRAAKRVRRQDQRLILTCPVCAHVWPYVPDGQWT
jgi:hypothetical protein